MGRSYLPLRSAVRALGSLDALGSLATVSAAPGCAPPRPPSRAPPAAAALTHVSAPHPRLQALSKRLGPLPPSGQSPVREAPRVPLCLLRLLRLLCLLHLDAHAAVSAPLRKVLLFRPTSSPLITAHLPLSWRRFTRPEMVGEEGEGCLVVQGGRHPMLDLLSVTPVVRAPCPPLYAGRDPPLCSARIA